MKTLRIKSIKFNDEKSQVFDLTVEKNENYTLENGVVTHNSGALYGASQIIFLNKSKEKEGTEHVGAIIQMTTFKGRVTKEGSQAKTKLSFSAGLDPYYGLMDLVKEGNIWPIEGNRFVINGTKTWEKTILANPTEYFTDEVLAKIDEVAKKKYLYGTDLESLPAEEEGE